MKRRGALLWLAVPGAVLAAAQSPPPATTPPPPRPIFAAQSDLVLVDATVTDGDDRPVFGLTAADFRVTEDGAARTIVSFAAFGSPPSPAAATRDPAARPGIESVPAPAPRPVPGATALFIDEGHMTPAECATAQDALKRIVGALRERGGAILVLAPFANVAFGGRFPDDEALVLEGVRRARGRRFPLGGRLPMSDAEALAVESGDTSALDRVVARFQFLNPGYGTQAANDVRQRATELAVAAHARRRNPFAAMRVAFSWLEKQAGRRTFLLVSAGFPYDRRDPSFDSIFNESFRVNAPIHFLDASAHTPMGRFEGIDARYALPQNSRVAASDFTESLGGSRLLALDTGGRHLGVSDVDRGLRSIIDATRNYYVLGYERSPNTKPGFRKIEVEARREGLRVRARRGYFDAGSAPDAVQHDQARHDLAGGDRDARPVR